MLNIGEYITEVERYQADGNGYHNGYDKLEGDWALYYKIAQYFVHKVKREDRLKHNPGSHGIDWHLYEEL